MSTTTRPRTDTEITFTGAYTCTHHSDQQRAACPVCLVAALTAERDQLRQQVANLTYSNNAHRETAETWRAAAIERDQLRADCEAEAERYRLVTLRLDAELAKERARLDWLMAGGMCLVQHSGGFHVSRLHCQVSRAAIDLGMKEDAE